MLLQTRLNQLIQRVVSIILVFALFIGIFPARIIHAEDPEEDLFISESSEEMAEDYAIWPYDTLPEEDAHLDENANITEENLLNREEAIKDFHLDNGMNVAVSYPYSVHYKENEEWKEIDNTLKSVEYDKGVFYHNQAGMWDVYLPQIINENNSVTVIKGGNSLSFSFEGELYDDDEITNINVTTGVIEEKEYPEEYDEPDMQILKKIVSSVNYADVYEDTDLRYDLISNCLKETVILDSYKEGLTGYRYRLYTEDLVLQLQEDKTILAYKKDEPDGDPAFWLPAPFLYDSKGEYSHDIEVTLTKEEDSYLLSYGLPEDWLSDNEREYPVRLDPVIQPVASYVTINDVSVPENDNPDVTGAFAGVGIELGGIMGAALYGFMGSVAGDLIYSEITLTEFDSGKAIANGIVASVFNVASCCSPRLLGKFYDGLSKLGKTIVDFTTSAILGVTDAFINYKTENNQQNTGVKLNPVNQSSPSYFAAHNGGGKMVMMRA